MKTLNEKTENIKTSLFSHMERKYNLSNQQVTIKTLDEKTKKTYKRSLFSCVEMHLINLIFDDLILVTKIVTKISESPFTR